MIGPLADAKQDMLGSWSAAGDGNKCISLLEGLQSALSPNTKITYEKGCDVNDNSTVGIAKAVSAARSAQVVILALGESRDMLIMGSACTSTTTPQLANSVPPSDAQKWIKRLNNGHYPDYEFVKHTPIGEAILKPLAADTALRVKFYFGYSSVDKQSSLFSLFAKGVEEAGKYTIDTNVVFHFNGKDWEPCSFMLLKEYASAWAICGRYYRDK